MTVIKPFAALRPQQRVVHLVAALPYDVYSREEARHEVEGKPLSFLNIDRPETQFAPEIDLYADCVYEKAAELLQARKEDKTLIQEETPCYYLYALTMNGRTQTGIAGCFAIDDYLSSVIKKHEKTRAEKEADRIRHVSACSAQTGPIFLACRSSETLRRLIDAGTKQAPLYDFCSEDGIRHRVWKIEADGSKMAIQKALEELPAVYIADGHHRAASAVKAGLQKRAQNPHHTGEEEYNFVLSVLFPEEELRILPYHRVVKDLNGLTAAQFFDAVSASFVIRQTGKEPYEPSEKGTFGMYLDGMWYCLAAKKEIRSDDPVEGLDVSILQNNLLAPILGIGDPRTDRRIDFVGGIRGVRELERRAQTDMKLAFSMYPTSISELLAVADAGRLMPPKSTWFEPKLRSGILIHEI